MAIFFWERPVSGNTPIARWNNKIRVMRKHLSGWANRVTGIFFKTSYAYHLLLMI
jgi:hypothetical protein